MKKTFVLAPDSFKESMTALQACQAMQRGIAHVFKDADFILLPMADGGEGTLDAIMSTGQALKCSHSVIGPLPTQQIAGYFALLEESNTAVIEMALVNGMVCLAPEHRNPWLCSSYGTGEMMLAALDAGVERIVVAVGGSLTNDAGMGMAQALGVKFLDQNGQTLALGAQYLNQVVDIDVSGIDPRLAKVEVMIASDVNNPLYGPQGASHVFAAQKGASPEMIVQLDCAVKHFADRVQSCLGLDYAEIAGAGAAGGLAYGLMVFAQAQMQSGVEWVIAHTDLHAAIQRADYVFTGEGALDAQTLMGKTPYGVAKAAKAQHKPVIACAGKLGEGVEALYSHGFDAIFGILDRCSTTAQACLDGEKNLERCSRNIAQLIQCSEALSQLRTAR